MYQPYKNGGMKYVNIFLKIIRCPSTLVLISFFIWMDPEILYPNPDLNGHLLNQHQNHPKRNPFHSRLRLLVSIFYTIVLT